MKGKLSALKPRESLKNDDKAFQKSPVFSSVESAPTITIEQNIIKSKAHVSI